MKVLSKAHVIRQDQVLNVQREIEIMRKMRHPFIVSYGTHFQDERHLYITAQFVRGGELYSVMQRTRAISNHFAVLYAAELLLALEHMHQNDVVYVLLLLVPLVLLALLVLLVLLELLVLMVLLC